MNNKQAITIIRKMIKAERKMREYVFRHDSNKKKLKVAECNNALAALDWLIETHALLPPEQEQLSMFDMSPQKELPREY